MKPALISNVLVRSLSVVSIVVACATSHPALAGDDHHRGPIFHHPRKHVHILPPQPRHSQRIYSEYQARWWQWATSLPADHNPLLDTADGTAGQAGPVWNLGGVFGSGPVERTLTVSAAKALFFPVLNLAYFLTEMPPDTEEGSRDLINTIMDHIVSSFVEIDGRPVAHLERYRTESRLFEIGPLPANNIVGVDAGRVVPTVDDGIYLLLLSLSPGEHTIHFGGRVFVPEDVLGFEYEIIQDVTYHLTVESKKK